MINKKKFKNKEFVLGIFFGILLLVIVARLFFLQILEASYYKKLLFFQHYKMYLLSPQRGNIYIENQTGNKIALTQNVSLFDIFVDPKFIPDKQKFIDIITPYIYKHLCKKHGIDEVENKKQCIENIEQYTKKQILPKQDKIFLISGDKNQLILQTKEYEKEVENIVANFTTGMAYQYIKERLNQLIKTGYKELNYLGFYDDQEFLEEVGKLPFVKIIDNYYVYIDPNKVSNFKEAKQKLKNLLNLYGIVVDEAKIDYVLHRQPIRYIKIAKNVYPEYKKELEQLKKQYWSKRINGIPLLHGLGFEKHFVRYYPLGEFLANALGYVDEKGLGHYGLEEYFNDLLAGKPGKVYGLSAHGITSLTKRGLKVQPPIDGSDIYLTIDIDLQKKLEQILKYRYINLKADSVAAVIIDPYTGKIKAIANWPTFNPNFYKQVYKIRPLTYKDQYLLEDDTYIDIPILIETGGKLKVATLNERKDLNLKKYIFKNLLGPQVFVDKNISMPYEPGSVFKTFTLAIGIDSDSIDLYDFYEDKGWIKVGPYKIKNVAKECKGTHTFLHALEWSCNVGMAKIAEKVKKYVYYNYLQRLGFGKKTGIQLAGEAPGDIPALRQFSKARFFNNTFGQGILVTPIQLAVGYSAMVNGGNLIKPTIVEKIYNPNTKQRVINKPQVIDKIFSAKTSEDIKLALYKVIYEGDLPMLAISGYTLGGKTGTSQIAFKGRYQQGAGWTNGSFVGIVTKDNLKYVIAVQVRRPRTCQWGVCSAGKIFKDIAQYLIERDGIEK